MPDVLAYKAGPGSFAIHPQFADDVQYIGLGEEVKMKISKVRHPGRHKRYWKLVDAILTVDGINEAFNLQNLSNKQAKQIIHDQLKIDSGCCYTRQAEINGEKYLIKTPKSINFDTMEDTEFNDFYQTAINVLIREWLTCYVTRNLDQWVHYFATNF